MQQPTSSFPGISECEKDYSVNLTRRNWLELALAASAISAANVWGEEQEAGRRPKVAVVLTAFYYRSHAHVILENFLTKYLFCGQVQDPGCDVVAIYADQFPEKDMTRDVCKQFGIPLYGTVAEALCLGGESLAVDAVLLIGEHGDYPKTEHGIVKYPRKELFDACVAVMQKSGRVVPLFNDKHLSYRFDWSREMYDTAQKMKIPFMAGSSVPLAERRPKVAVPSGAKMVEAVSIHAGPLESYDFHGLEVLQSMVEFRAGGETGVASVQYLGPDALWEAQKRGEWSLDLANAAAKSALAPTEQKLEGGEKTVVPSYGILVKYKDGLKGIVLSVPGNGTHWCFAAKLEESEKPLVTSFHVGPWNNRNLFKALCHAIQQFFRSGVSPYPVERTLLTSGILDAMMRSYGEKGAVIETPELAIAYAAKNFDAYREDGSTWKLITDAIKQPQGIETILPSGS